MIAEVVLSFFNLFFTILSLAIVARALVSWFPVDPYHPAVILLDQITEPFIAPLRRIVPPLGMMDITPIVALILIRVLQALVTAMLTPYIR
jgi:YggT family protein